MLMESLKQEEDSKQDNVKTTAKLIFESAENVSSVENEHEYSAGKTCEKPIFNSPSGKSNINIIPPYCR
jgi:hypothetical protein